MTRSSLVFLIVSLIVMMAYILYVQIFSSITVLQLITHVHIDKIFHALGGAFIAGALFSLFGKQKYFFTLFVVFVAAISWEVIEALWDPKTLYFIEHSRAVWIKDTVIDIFFGLFGAFLYIKDPI